MRLTTLGAGGLLAAGTALLITAAPAQAATVPTRVATATTPFATTNGDVLAVHTAVSPAGRRVTVFGGNFTAIITPDNVSHPATNLGVVDATTGALVFAGRADSYVRTITALGSKVYIGGDFLHIGSVARSRLAALDTGTWAVSRWNPTAPSRVRALDSAGSTVYVGDGNRVRALTTAGALRWQDNADCSVNTVLVSPDQQNLYLGGFFTTVNGAGQHALVKVAAASGVVNATFRPILSPNSGPCGGPTKTSYDGEDTISLTYDSPDGRIVAGQGGIQNTVRSLDAVTGAGHWKQHTPGDAQAVSMVGRMVFVGYHRNAPNPDGSYTNYFASLRDAKSGALLAWDPGLTGNQPNADGGNNGVQGSWFDTALNRLYLGGSFFPPKSLAVFQAS